MSRVGAWAAFVVVAGLLAMHGLASHGAMGSMSEPVTVSASSVASAPSGARHGSSHHDPSDHDGAMPSMAGCVAVLGLGLLLLGLVLLLLRSPRRGWLAARVVRREVVARVRARAPDPPDLWTLSVCRC